MKNSTKQDGHEPLYNYIPLIQQERPLFEANYIQIGGDLQFLRWGECDDGSGIYQPNWEKIGLLKHETEYAQHDFAERIMHHAEHIQSRFMSWVECARSKAIPVGYYLMPIQPSEEMLKQAELEFHDLDIEDIQDRIVFSHQAMIEVLNQSAE